MPIMPHTFSASFLNHEPASATVQRLAVREAMPALSESRQQSPIEMLLALLRTMETHNPGHGDRTANYAVALGNAVGLARADLIHLHYAALLHDIGKLTVPDEILEKDGPLTGEEYALVQSHPRAAAELLEPISFLRVQTVLIAHHHERWDGTGYPYGLRGSFIPLGSRILAVADTFDALTSNRPYQPARHPESALRLLQRIAGSQLDPELVKVFVGLTAKFLEPAT
ncbi:MAG: HD domain-containing protein [Nitrospirae bacterium]|nr:HD domain-containing protein [Nitrospirota bacterium]